MPADAAATVESLDVPATVPSRIRRELTAVALAVAALFLAGALLLMRVPDGAGCTAAIGPFGPLGGCVSWAVLGLLGVAGALIVPLIPLVHALRLFRRTEASADRHWLIFTTGMALLLPLAAGLARGVRPEAGVLDPVAGLWGGLTSHYVRAVVGEAGAWLVVLLLFSTLTVATIAWNPIRELLHLRPRVPARGARTIAEVLAPPSTELPSIDAALAHELSTPAAVDATGAGGEPIPPRRAKSPRVPGGGEGRTIATEPERVEAPSDDILPPLDLLREAPPHDAARDQRALDENGERLMDALRTFKVDGDITGRTSGPTVTQYEITPAPGVKVRQIASLSNDIALAMRAASIRIVAPIPGRGAVGVEVPNPTRESVVLRDLLESRDYAGSARALPIALGKDLEGRPVIADLAKMPHLLIAGATGSGKSVCVNTIITSLVYRHTPTTLRFLMVDPKMVELSVYNALPHLRHKVITDNRDAAAILKWAVMEMQERYRLLAENGARNVQDFNEKVRAGAPLRTPRRPDVAFEVNTYTGGVLPYIVVVIDELADLMMTVQAEVETPLAMLAQKARAIGIHLILATQRPSVNVITGLIKANFPSRIAFRVASQVDSRTILDGMGAESLLGNGDMLFIPPGKSEPDRLQGAFLANEETEALMAWYADRREARLAAGEPVDGLTRPGGEEDILEKVRAQDAAEAGASEANEDDVGDRDKLFREAAEICIQHQGGSTSLLQRRLRIGYGRAARIIDQLHLAGVLGPPDGSKPRDVLMGLQDLDGL